MRCERCGRVGAASVPEWPLLEGMTPPVLCGACLAALTRRTAERLREIDASFDGERAAELAARAQSVSAELPARLDAVMLAVAAASEDPAALRAAIVSLLELLASAEGCTHANVRRASEELSRRGAAWAGVPEPYGELLRTMSGPMRGARWEPELTEALGAQPRQLVERARRGAMRWPSRSRRRIFRTRHGMRAPHPYLTRSLLPTSATNNSEARSLLHDFLAPYRTQSHRALQQLLLAPVATELRAPSGKRYQVVLQAGWTDVPGRDLRVVGGISQRGWQQFTPQVESFVVVPAAAPAIG